MESISMRGEYYISDVSEEEIYTKLLDFERRYQRHQKRWTIYCKKDRKGNIILQARDHNREIPRGRKPSMPRIKIGIRKSDNGVCISYCCKWPLYYYVLVFVWFFFAFVFCLVADSVFDGLYFIFLLFIFAILNVWFYSPDRNYKRDCVVLFDELMKRNFTAIESID